MKPITVVCLAVLLLFASCSGRLYSHYSFVKQDKKPAIEIPRHKARIPPAAYIRLKNKLPEPIDISLPVDTVRALLSPATRSVKAIPDVTKQVNTAPVDTVAAIEPGVNKKAQLAFWGSFVTIGSFALAFISPWLLIIPFVLTVLTIVYAFLAIKEISVSGEYGLPKAEFALFLMIPLLLAEFVAIYAAYMLLTGRMHW